MKCIPGDYLMKLVERMPRMCKAVIKANGGYLKNLKYKIYFELFNTFFGYYMIPYVSFHSFDVFTSQIQLTVKIVVVGLPSGAVV